MHIYIYIQICTYIDVYSIHIVTQIYIYIYMYMYMKAPRSQTAAGTLTGESVHVWTYVYTYICKYTCCYSYMDVCLDGLCDRLPDVRNTITAQRDTWNMFSRKRLARTVANISFISMCQQLAKYYAYIYIYIHVYIYIQYIHIHRP